MTTAARFQEQLKHVPIGRPFTTAAFRHLASPENSRQIFSRAVKKGELKRIGNGIFVKPKKISIGEMLPSVAEILEVISQKTGEVIAVHGAEAARQFQLSTQVSVKPIFYTSGNSRTIKLSGRTVTLKHVSPSKLVSAGTKAGTAISALHYLGKENMTAKTIEQIKKQLTTSEFNELINLTERMPLWMAKLFYTYKNYAE